MNKLEPDADEASFTTISKERSLHSIAISLKRIADIMQGKQQPVIMSADEYAKYLTLDDTFSHVKSK